MRSKTAVPGASRPAWSEPRARTLNVSGIQTVVWIFRGPQAIRIEDRGLVALALERRFLDACTRSTL